MKFARIEMLFLIWVIPVLLMAYVYGIKRRNKILSGFSSEKGLSVIAPEVGHRRRKIKAGLLLCGLIFLVFSLTGPRYGFRWQEIERKGIDIIIAIDCSRSMMAQDVKPTRLDRAKREIYDLLHMLQGDRAGLVSFAGTAFLQCPLTLDYDTFYLFLDALSPDFMPVGGTDISAALKTAISGFSEKDNSEKAIILITDGESTGENPLKAAESAAKAGIKLFCIGVGKEDGAPVPDKSGGLRKNKAGKIIITKIDENMLKKISVLTGGSYVRSVAGDMDLEAIYLQEIRGKMEASTLSSGRKQIWEDRYQWFLAVAFIFFAVELFLSSKKAKTNVLVVLCMVFTCVLPAQAAGVYKSMQAGLEAYKNGEYETALKNFIDAQLEEPDRPEIYYNIGNAYYKLGNYEEAAKNYSQVFISKDNKIKSKALYNAGNSNFRMNQFKEAVSHYEDALKINPDDMEAKKNLEFTRKIMEKKKKQPYKTRDKGKKEKGGEKQQEENRKNNQSKKDREKADKSKTGSSEKERTPSEYGKELGKEKAKEQGLSTAEAKGNSRDDGNRQPGKEGFAPRTPEEKKQAEKMLNRLHDKPGMGMMPAYRKKYVEKDW